MEGYSNKKNFANQWFVNFKIDPQTIKGQKIFETYIFVLLSKSTLTVVVVKKKMMEKKDIVQGKKS